MPKTKAEQILKQYWGYDGFRPNQAQIINSVLAGFDTLALLPTGGGKSICFQVPALLLPGITLVVSPLIALMQDQVERLRSVGVKAEMLVSGMHRTEIDRILDNCVYGDIQLLYVSPERLKTEIFIERWKKMKAALIAVDEAHCISQWGYDFRPAYLEIAEIRKWHPDVPVMALTATATPPVVKDIQQRLGFPEDKVFQSSFERENLGYNILHTENKLAECDRILRRMPGSIIIYAGTRKNVAEWAQFLQSQGHPTAYYHAGLEKERKNQMRQLWMSGKARIIVATNAFGMGIDKPDVRLVMHIHVPPNLESYFQEAGRAGRDGERAHALMLWNRQDIARLEDFVQNKYPPIEEIKRVYKGLGSLFNLAIGAGEGTSHSIDIRSFSHRFGLSALHTYSSLKLLEAGGFISINEDGIISSKLMVTGNKNALYSYQVANPEAEKLLKYILRSTGGLFERHQNISENDLAMHMKKQPGDIRIMLQKMHDLELVDYLPILGGTVINYETERLQENNLSLPAQVYQNRKKIDFLRLRSVKQYVFRFKCRSQQLLAYFGEEAAKTCGKCDVCRRAGKLELSPDIMDQLLEAIRLALGEDKVSVTTLLDRVRDYDPQKIKELVRFQLDAGELCKNENDEIYLQEF